MIRKITKFIQTKHLPKTILMASLSDLRILLESDFPKALELMREVAQGTRLENDLLLLNARYNNYAREHKRGTLYAPEGETRRNRIIHAAAEYLTELEKLRPTQLSNLAINKSGNQPDGNNSNPPSNVTHIYNAPVYQNSHIFQFNYHDFRQEFLSNEKPLTQLIEAEQSNGYISHEEYEELMEILDEIKETKTEPTPKQQKKWKRWLGKASEAGKKFVGGRLEKGMDSAIGESAKKWAHEGGIDRILEWVSQLG